MLARLSKITAVLCFLVLNIVAFAAGEVTWKADAPTGKAGDVVTVNLTATIGPGWHLYSLKNYGAEGPNPTTITAVAPLTISGKIEPGKVIKKRDPNFDLDVEFFEKTGSFKVPVKLGPEGAKGSLKVRFQVCNDTTCIPPQTIEVPLGGDTANAGSAATVGPKKDNSDAFANSVTQAKNNGLFSFIILSFGAGLLSLLTPCVFPMIPITVSYFTKRRANGQGGYSGVFAYCGGIVGSFAGFGVIVSAVFGASGIQRFATNPWVNLGLAAIFVVLALSLFGALHLQLPSSLTNKVNSAQGKGGLIAAAAMGMTFTLTSFTCTVPAVGTILAGAAQGDLLYPLVGMLAYGTAFALPFFLLALFPQALSKLPKSGAWLDMVKATMGFVEIMAAMKFLSNADLVLGTNLLQRPLFLGIWTVLALACGLFLLGILKIPTVDVPKEKGIGRWGFGVAFLVMAVWFGGSVKGKSLGELEAFMPPTKVTGWMESYDKALVYAKQVNKPLLVNFTGVTCTNCRWMERNMFPRDAVVKELDKYVLVELYTDRDTEADRKNQSFEQELTGVTSLPVYVTLTPEGKKVKVLQGSTREEETFVSFLRGPLSASR